MSIMVRATVAVSIKSLVYGWELEACYISISYKQTAKVEDEAGS